MSPTAASTAPADDHGDARRRDRPRQERGSAAAHDALRSQSETCTGCTVSFTTRSRSAAQLVEVDLPAQPCAERLQRALGVVAAPVEAAVDEALDARAQRQEERRDDERRGGDREVRAARERREHRLPREHEPRIREPEQHGERAVDERARDQQVDVEEPVAEDRDRDRHRDRGHADVPEHGRHRAVAGEAGDDDADDGERPGQREQLELLPLHGVAVPVAHDQRGRARGRAADEDARSSPGRRSPRCRRGRRCRSGCARSAPCRSPARCPRAPRRRRARARRARTRRAPARQRRDGSRPVGMK